MRRFMLILALVALSGCAAVYDDRYSYYRGDGYGDYYYDHYDRPRIGLAITYGDYGYSAYDSLFWGLQYTYFDPFWYPHFYYGVTYFPRYYGWSYWHAHDYWRWRHFHPYSPYYGSYWDHYYAWYRPGYRGHWRDRAALSDPQRYGSARNAAERMARSRDHGRDYSVRDRAWAAQVIVDDSRSVQERSADGVYQRPSARRSGVWLRNDLPSRNYVPESRRRAVSSGWQEPGRDSNAGQTNRRYRALGGESTDAVVRGDRPNTFQSRVREPGLFSAPAPTRQRSRSAEFSSRAPASSPSTRSFRSSPRPVIQSERGAPMPRSSGPDRGGGLDRSSRSRRER